MTGYSEQNSAYSPGLNERAELKDVKVGDSLGFEVSWERTGVQYWGIVTDAKVVKKNITVKPYTITWKLSDEDVIGCFWDDDTPSDEPKDLRQATYKEIQADAGAVKNSPALKTFVFVGATGEVGKAPNNWSKRDKHRLASYRGIGRYYVTQPPEVQAQREAAEKEIERKKAEKQDAEAAFEAATAAGNVAAAADAAVKAAAANAAVKASEEKASKIDEATCDTKTSRYKEEEVRQRIVDKIIDQGWDTVDNRNTWLDILSSGDKKGTFQRGMGSSLLSALGRTEVVNVFLKHYYDPETGCLQRGVLIKSSEGTRAKYNNRLIATLESKIDKSGYVVSDQEPWRSGWTYKESADDKPESTDPLQPPQPSGTNSPKTPPKKAASLCDSTFDEKEFRARLTTAIKASQTWVQWGKDWFSRSVDISALDFAKNRVHRYVTMDDGEQCIWRGVMARHNLDIVVFFIDPTTEKLGEVHNIDGWKQEWFTFGSSAGVPAVKPTVNADGSEVSEASKEDSEDEAEQPGISKGAKKLNKRFDDVLVQLKALKERLPPPPPMRTEHETAADLLRKVKVLHLTIKADADKMRAVYAV